ncbi:Transcription factor [Malassezia psittaci]|uniref:Transcription factor n=1 Tax=Malassezia psittaci TaxID=1821823 RepID=A0AAF0FH08_9BASI|nr:Transcription factor [Malassezia psittaci]
MQPLDGGYPRSMLAPSPLDVHTTPSRTDPSTSELHGSQLGGTAWLGLGGGAGRASLVGDSGGGGEMTILSEFLESLDDGNSWYTCTDKPTNQTSDGTEFAFKPNMATMTPAQFQRTTPTTKMLNTPPSMASAGPESLDAGGFALAHHSSDMSILSPNKAELGRPAANTTTLSNIGETAQEDPSSRHDSHDMAAETEARRSMKYTSEPHREQQEDLHSLQTKDISSTEPYPPVLDQNASKTERFLLTAADQTDGSRDERLRKVIQAKYEAGLLRPYNHVNGYARLNRWMDQNVSASSRRRILKPLSVFRPVFVSIAKKLTQYDLIYIEEAFERLLLDYDRVFSIQSIPACLWRRTGEIYKGNKEFADLVGVPIESLREGRLCIYELMAEESAVNYWEKYGSVSFDPSQKAVLTMCKLFTKQAHLPKSHTGSQSTGAQQSVTAPASEPGKNNRTSPSLELQSSPSEPESRHDLQASPTAPSHVAAAISGP